MPPSNYNSEVDPNNAQPVAAPVPGGSAEPAEVPLTSTPAPMPAEPAEPTMPVAPQPAVMPSAPVSAPFPSVTVSGGNYAPHTEQSVGMPAKRKFSRPIITAIVAGLVIIGAAAAAYMMFLKPPTPDEAFKQALVNALSTKTFTQDSNTEDEASQLTQHYDLSNIKQAKLDATIKIGFEDSNIVLEGYGTPKNSYFRITQAKNTIDYGPLEDTWVQVKKDGRLPDDVTLASGASVFFDPDYSSLGQYIFGNFDAKSRKTLVDYATTQQVYKYDSSKVKKTKLNGHDVYAYDVKLSGKKLEAYNRKAAPMFGIADSKVDNLADQFEDMSATMYVTLDTERLVQVKTDEGDVTKYSAWDSTTVASEPKPKMQMAEFNLRLAGVLASPSNQSDGTSGLVLQKSKDTERKTDINALMSHVEAYYAGTGFYPTLSEINDANWRSTNMKGLDPDALQDPDGSGVLVATPAAGSYAYQVGADASFSACQPDTCQYYKLTATLHDGTKYSRESF
jgi:hypothetical protein